MQLSLLLACSKSNDEDTTVDVTYTYFPLSQGMQWLYQVDSLVYDDNTGHTTIDTFIYKYKEVVGEAIGNTEEFRLYRYFQQNDSAIWTESNAWVIGKNNFAATKNHENRKYMKLSFPLKEGKTWNGNLYNSKEAQEFEAVNFDKPFGNYAKTVQVNHFHEENRIEEIRRYEVYARDIGMIYSLSDSLNTQEKGTRGIRYRLTLLSFVP